MSDLVHSGGIVWIALAFLVAEIVFLALWRNRHGHPPQLARLVAAGLPGAFLLVALGAALTAQSWIWVALSLALSLPAHVADMRLRPP